MYIVCEGKSITTRRKKIISEGGEVFSTDFGDAGNFKRINHLVEKGILKKVDAIEVTTDVVEDTPVVTAGGAKPLTPAQKTARTKAANKAKKEAEEKAAAEAKEKADAEAALLAGNNGGGDGGGDGE